MRKVCDCSGVECRLKMKWYKVSTESDRITCQRWQEQVLAGHPNPQPPNQGAPIVINGPNVHGEVRAGCGELGDLVEAALTKVGITSERVSRWIGRPCGCKERKEKLNAISAWARRVIAGKVEDAAEHLKRITS